MKPFPARFASVCVHGDAIAVGELLVYEGSKVAHAVCPPTALDRLEAKKPCPTCWMVGACDCGPS